MTSRSCPTIVVEDQTNLEAVHFTLKWSIHDFEVLKSKATYLYSPGITMAELGMEDGYRGRWRIAVKPCYSITEDHGKKNYISVSLALTDEDLKSTTYTGGRALLCLLKRRVTTGKLMDVPVHTATEFSEVLTFSSKAHSWAQVKLIDHLDLFGSGAKALRDSCLHFTTEVIIYKEPTTTRTSPAGSPSLLQRYQEFLGRQMKQQETSGDFVIISSDRQEFLVDQCLLMAHSSVFAAMLTHDSKEKQTLRCKMKDVDGECVGILQDYIYGCETGKIQGHNAEKVLMMADKYQMTDLRAVCEMTLANNITVDNAVQVYVLARRLDLDKLKDVTKKFIRMNMDLDAILDESF